MTPATPRTVLIIAGLDPCGGAGLLADARIVAEHGFRAAGAATVLTEQDTRGLRAASPVEPELLSGQLRAVLSDIEVAAVKIGALGDESIARTVAEALSLTAAPVVWDPVLRATSGPGALYAGDPAAAFAALAPHLALITPNLAEAERLAGRRVADPEAMEEAARALSAQGAAVLVKGGHLSEAQAVDVLARGEDVARFTSERIAGGAGVHGTGCALSTAIACGLAAGAGLEDAVRDAKAFVQARLRSPVAPGRGAASIV